ncbi:MAG TPA: amino acid ABC transporter substrate-binding protein [Burkholderiales bacterium]|nr:amino acid ABC transporter substrate-binding protein [Burkholderiales bacterium]
MHGYLRLFAFALAAALAAPTDAQQTGGTLAKIRDARTIALGYRADAPPFSFNGHDGQPAGYSVDLCHRIAASIRATLGVPDLQVRWVPVTPDNRIDLVRQGRIDLECGTTTATLARQEQVDFSNPTFVDGGGLLVRVDSKVWQLRDLAGRKVAVGRTTTAAQRLPEVLKARGVSAQIVHVASAEEAIAMLETGGVDAYANDRIILLGAATRARDPGRLVLSDEDFSVEPYGLVMRRDDSSFRLAVNRGLAEIYRSGAIQEIYDRWLAAIGRPSVLLQAIYYVNALPE